MKEYTKDGKVLDSIQNLQHNPNIRLLYTRSDVGKTLNMGTKSNQSSLIKWITPMKSNFGEK